MDFTPTISIHLFRGHLKMTNPFVHKNDEELSRFSARPGINLIEKKDDGLDVLACSLGLRLLLVPTFH